MISEQPTQTNHLLSDEQKMALLIMTKLIPQLSDKSFKPNNLKDDRLHFLRRIVKRLSEELINRS
jgi:hypothetical protein